MAKGSFLVSSKITSLFRMLKEQCVDLNKFIENLGLDNAILTDPDFKVSIQHLDMIIQSASKLLKDDSIGLHMAQQHLTFSNIVGYVLMNCQNIYEMIHKYKKYQKIIDSIVNITPLLEEERLVLKYDLLDENFKHNNHILDYYLAGTLNFIINFVGVRPKFLEVKISRSLPVNISEYEKVFDSNVKFNSSINALIFDKDYIEKPILHRNQNLFEMFENQASDILRQLSLNETYTEKVSRLLVKSIGAEVPTIDYISKRLAISVRNLQTKLKKEGTTYREILKNIRKEMAFKYLRDKNVSITEISYLLGFSEPSVFNKTFKIWTGYTPGVYRSDNTRLEKRSV